MIVLGPLMFFGSEATGWWVVKKYNCVGCHEVKAGDQPNLWGMPWYQGLEETGELRSAKRPPTLVGQGLRTNPNWLMNFLRNPSLTEDAAASHRNGVRGYLDVRMPTFRLSDREVEKLARFFGALSQQPPVHKKTRLAPLDDRELGLARTLFSEIACVKCHMIGEAEWDKKATAPPLKLAVTGLVLGAGLGYAAEHFT